MSWALGLSLWIIFGGLAAFIFGEVARAQSKDRDHDHDHVADYKRRIERNAYRVKAGLK